MKEPIYTKQPRIPNSLREAVELKVTAWLKLCLIQPAQSKLLLCHYQRACRHLTGLRFPGPQCQHSARQHSPIRPHQMHQGNRSNQKHSFYNAESHPSLLATVTPSTSKPLHCLHGSRPGPISVGHDIKGAHWGPCQDPMTHGNCGTQASSHHCLHQ